jgi:rhamnosyltransferase
VKVALLIPTLNAGDRWIELLDSVALQDLEFSKKIIIDSGSTDQTTDLATKHGFKVIKIQKSEFDHGYARQLLVNDADDCEILVFLTQDALLKGSNAVRTLIKSFENDSIGLAYGRQLPNKGAEILETHARLFNYPPSSIIKELDDKHKLGIKTASCSNSFAAYRLQALKDAGGFPFNTIMAEDVIVAAKMLINGWKIAYVGDSEVYHSHSYSLVEEFRRYFDIGVYHSTNKWILDEFGNAEGEGFKYLISEFKYVLKHNVLLLPKMISSIGLKFIGYKLGMNYSLLPLKQRKSFSMHRTFWSKIQDTKSVQETDIIKISQT